jgi:uncharacterized protein (TIGR03437 family)
LINLGTRLVIVPYEVAKQPSATIEVISGNTKSTARGVAVAPSAPAIFSLASTGTGQAAVLNQDKSFNGLSNPAPRGTMVQIFATGEGQISPPGVTGGVTGSNTKSPVLPVAVTIGGVNAVVQYAGSAPNAVAGLFQVNAVVLQSVTPSPAVPISVSVGGVTSQDGMTVAVK